MKALILKKYGSTGDLIMTEHPKLALTIHFAQDVVNLFFLFMKK